MLRNLSSAHLSDFSLFSTGIILLGRGRSDLLQAVEDLFVRGSYALLRLEADDMPAVVSTIRRYNLDFDDAYQHTVAEKFDVTIVSFDSDFDRTERGRKTPAEVLEETWQHALSGGTAHNLLQASSYRARSAWRSRGVEPYHGIGCYDTLHEPFCGLRWLNVNRSSTTGQSTRMLPGTPS